MSPVAFRIFAIPGRVNAPVITVAVRCNDLEERFRPIATSNSSATHVVSGPSGSDCAIRRLCEDGAGKPLFFTFSRSAAVSN